MLQDRTENNTGQVRKQERTAQNKTGQVRKQEKTGHRTRQDSSEQDRTVQKTRQDRSDSNKGQVRQQHRTGQRDKHCLTPTFFSNANNTSILICYLFDCCFICTQGFSKCHEDESISVTR